MWFKAAANRRERAKGEEDLFFEEKYTPCAGNESEMCLIYLQFPRGFEIFLLSERARDFFSQKKHTREKFGQKENEYAEGENFQKTGTGISKKTRARVLLLFFSRLFVTASYCLV